MKKVFVTVGTTKFEKLIEKLSQDELLDVLCRLGYNFVQFQVGAGTYKERHHPKMKLRYKAYFEEFSQQIEDADLIISHAGAGTCLEVLQRRKPLIVVVNEDLMDNHQMELAEQLASDEHLKCCNITTLKDVLLHGNLEKLKPYPNPEPKLFSQYLDRCMGFEIN